MDVVSKENALLVEYHVAAELFLILAKNARKVIRWNAQAEGVEERVADESKEEVEEVVSVLAGVITILELRIIANVFIHLHVHV